MNCLVYSLKNVNVLSKNFTNSLIFHTPPNKLKKPLSSKGSLFFLVIINKCIQLCVDYWKEFIMSGYFAEYKRGEINDLRNLLREASLERDEEKQRFVSKYRIMKELVRKIFKIKELEKFFSTNL